MATIEELLRQRFGNIGAIPSMPTYSDGMSALERAQATPMFTNYDGSQVPFLPGADGGARVALTDPADPAGQGGVYGNFMGAFDPSGQMTGMEYTPQQRSGTWLDSNPWAVLGLPLGAAALGGAFGGVAAAPAAGASELTAAVAPAADLAVPAGFSGAGDLLTLTSSGAAPTMAGESLLGSGITAGGGMNAGGITALGGAGAGGLSVPAGATLGTMPLIGGLAGSAATGAAGAAGNGLMANLMNPRNLVTAAGGLAGALGSNASPTTASQSVPEWALPFAADLMRRGQAIGDTPFQPFGDQRFAGPNDASKAAWEMVNQAATTPTAQQGQAAAAYGSLLSGATPDFGRAERVNNQYIGATTPTAANPYIGQTTGSDVSSLVKSQSNPYLGLTTDKIGSPGTMSLAQTTTDVARNPLFGLNNPYLNSAIQYAQDDVTRNFNNTVNPQFDRMARASGSFGNTGVEQARGEAQRNLANELGRIGSNMRMQDYSLQAGLGESDAARRTSTALTDAQRNLGASQAEQSFNLGMGADVARFNAGLQAQDLARNLSGANTQQGNLLQAGMFDTTQRANDLSRNASLAQSLGQFNAGLGQTDLARNASLTAQQGQFNAGQGNQDIANSIGTWNASQNRVASTLPQWQNFAEQPFRAASALGNVGTQMNQYAQQPLDFNFQEFMRRIQYPTQAATDYGNLYRTGVGGNSTTTQSASGTNPFASAIGGAIGVNQLFNLLGGQPTMQRY